MVAIFRGRPSRAAQLRDSLSAVALFSTCSRRDLQIVARHMHVLELPGRTVLIREGETGDAFYVLLEGSATVSQEGSAIAAIEAGDHFGELALLDPAPRDATVTAGTDVVVGVLGARAFNAIVRDVPGMNAKLLRALARRLREADLKSTGLPPDAGQRGLSSPST
jgi:CRP/FNR family cyclic AMP-dependent transcriptional regulator